jgi:serine/threonine protein kinase
VDTLRSTIERLKQAGQMTPDVSVALCAAFARWETEGRPPCTPERFLRDQGLPEAWVVQLLHWRGLTSQEEASTVGLATDPGSGSARLTAFLRAGPFSRAQQLEGARLGNYRVQSEIARGGMGVVLRALDVRTGEPVALKVLLAGDSAQERARRRFQREAEVASRLDHSGLVRVRDFGQEEGLLFLVMDLIDGEPLSLVAREPRETAQILVPVARAVAHAHERGVVHRDLKPANVIVCPDGRLVVTDFGLVRDLEESSSLTQSGFALGTPHYMSPEQVVGEPSSPATDVYSMGVMLYQGLSGGETPFEGESVVGLFNAIRNLPPPRLQGLNPRVPPVLAAICMRALAKRPSERYADAGAFADELEAWLSGGKTQVGRALSLGTWRAALVGLACLALAGVGFGVASRSGPTDDGSVAKASPTPGFPEGTESPSSPVVETSTPTPTLTETPSPAPSSSPSPKVDPQLDPAHEAARREAQAALQNLTGLPPSEMLRRADRAVKLAPFWGQAWAFRARVRVNLKQTREALADLERASKAEEPATGTPFLSLRGVIRYQTGNYLGAVEDLAQVVDTDPSLLGTYGFALRACKRYGAAEKAIRAAIALGSTDWRLPFNLGGVLRDQKRIRDSISVYREALRLSRGEIWYVYRNLATSHGDLGEHSESERLILAALKRFGALEELVAHLAYVRIRQKKPASALKVANEYLALRPSPRLTLIAAGILADRGEISEALAKVERALKGPLKPKERQELEARRQKLRGDGED